jgi:hypothetical protein
MLRAKQIERQKNLIELGITVKLVDYNYFKLQDRVVTLEDNSSNPQR